MKKIIVLLLILQVASIECQSQAVDLLEHDLARYTIKQKELQKAKESAPIGLGVSALLALGAYKSYKNARGAFDLRRPDEEIKGWLASSFITGLSSLIFLFGAIGISKDLSHIDRKIKLIEEQIARIKSEYAV